ncbi:CBS domain-containing protein [Nocardioides sp.]|uniref:CBS domain-containing protein n=1 Tax=Nocardioides sp. TaxID=35761 RepID=UPI00261350BF|nr:CBS domain-containing protein [Nocardioides sp.]
MVTERDAMTDVRSVRDGLLTVSSTFGPSLTVAEALAAFENPKLHMLLITEHGRLLGTLTRPDLADAEPGPALPWSSLAPERLVLPDDRLSAVRRSMLAAGQRRRAVVGADGSLLGLLCLKRHGRDFCSDADVAARRAERELG